MHLPVVVGWFLDSLGTFLVGFFGLFFFSFLVWLFQHLGVYFSILGQFEGHFGATSFPAVFLPS